MESLDRGINGLGDNPGYKLDYRFHYLTGIIRLGNVRNYTQEIVNLSLAEQFFLQAGRYATKDYPEDAARAFLCAGWAAYCQGKMKDAKEHTKHALTINQLLGEAYFQDAKIEMHIGNPDIALPSLRKAIEIDRGYSLKAVGDDDFKRYEEKVSELIEQMTIESRYRSEVAMHDAQEAIRLMEDWHAKDQGIENASKALSRINEARESFHANTFYGYLDALSLFTEAKDLANVAFKTQQNNLKTKADTLINQTRGLRSYIEKRALKYTLYDFKDADKIFNDAITNQSKGTDYHDCINDIQRFENAYEAFVQVSKLSEERHKSHEQSFATTGGVIGFIMGGIVGVIFAFIVGFIPGVILALISEGTRSSIPMNIFGIWVLGCLIYFGVQGARGGTDTLLSWFRKRNK